MVILLGHLGEPEGEMPCILEGDHYDSDVVRYASGAGETGVAR
jgi:hypothetical protein